MGFRCGIVGLPNVGKSTIFNALTKSGAAAQNFPFCTIEPNVGRVPVPDPRLDQLVECITPQKTVSAAMEFVDIAGLVKGASKGEGLGNQFLANIRETDAIAHVVRCFQDDDITHVEGSVDPLRDIGIIEAELVMADYDTTSKVLDRHKKQSKSGDKKTLAMIPVLEGLVAHLEGLKPARSYSAFISPDSIKEELFKELKHLQLITAKQTLYVCNVSEEMAAGQTDNDFTKAVVEKAKTENAPVVRVCGKLEEELAQMDEADQKEFIADLGIPEPGLNRLIRSGYGTLGLQTYFTAGEKEVRAWTVPVGATAPEAAGKIHTDFQRGFICAEVYACQELFEFGTKNKLKESGKIRTEGKEYIVKDGDVMEFRFNV